jgi:hypothetical protein
MVETNDEAILERVSVGNLSSFAQPVTYHYA